MRARIRLATVGLAAAAILLFAAVALAAHPVKGATYSGHSTSPRCLHPGCAGIVSFKVSGNGRKVTKLSVPLVYCSGGIGGVRNPQLGSAKISKNGTFKTKVLVKAASGPKTWHFTVTGKFLLHGKEKGKLTSPFGAGKSKTCTWTYSTHG